MDDTPSDERPFRFSLRAMLLIVTLAAVLAGFIRLGLEIYKNTKVPAPPNAPPRTPATKRPMLPPVHPLVPPDKVSPI